jgi:hypothetical protein
MLGADSAAERLRAQVRAPLGFRAGISSGTFEPELARKPDFPGEQAILQEMASGNGDGALGCRAALIENLVANNHLWTDSPHPLIRIPH